MMFENYIKRGLGRAVTLLGGQTDKSPYRQPLIDYITDKKVKSYVSGEYKKQLIDCFDDKKELSREISEKLLGQIANGENISEIPLLILLGYGDAARDETETLYHSSYAELLDFTKQDDSDEKYPPCSIQYFSAVVALGRFLKVDRARIKQILFDIADLFDYSDAPAIPCYQNPLYSVMDGMERAAFYSLLDEVTAEHKHGEKLDIRKEFFTLSDIKPDPDIVAEDIMNSDKDNFPQMFVSFAHAPERVVRNVAEDILSERYDKEHRLYMMSFFTYGLSPDIEPPMFPSDLDPTLVIKWADSEKDNLTDDRQKCGTAEKLFEFMCYVHHLSVRNYAKQLLADHESKPILRQYAMRMLYGNNYQPEDKANLITLLQSDSPEKFAVIDAVIRNTRLMKYDFPEDVYSLAFCEAQPDTRERLVEALAASGHIPDRIKEECRLDGNRRIRKFVIE